MSDIEFRFVQPNEFDDWYYECHDYSGYICDIVYETDQWHLAYLKNNIGITAVGLEYCIQKIRELNKTTKPKNRLVF